MQHAASCQRYWIRFKREMGFARSVQNVRDAGDGTAAARLLGNNFLSRASNLGTYMRIQQWVVSTIREGIRTSTSEQLRRDRYSRYGQPG